jgi:hypothetical protein
MEIKRGSHITCRHRQSQRLVFYRVVEENETGMLRLLSLTSFYLMNGFKTKDTDKIVYYIENVVGCDIIKISE